MSELMKIAASKTPAKRKSILDPHLADLRRLQSEGYSLEQLREFLKAIGITVTRQSIYDFLKRRKTALQHESAIPTTKIDGLMANNSPSPTTATEGQLKKNFERPAKVADAKVAVRDLHLNSDLSLSDDTYETFKKKD